MTAPGTAPQTDPWQCAYCDQPSVLMLTSPTGFPIYVCLDHMTAAS